MKCATFFSGGEGMGLAFKSLGFKHVIGIEYDDKIAEVSRINGFNVLTADMLTLDPETLPDFDFAHFSTPCPNFSTAKANATETENDILLAKAVVNIITTQQPKYITLENVWAYRKSQSWQIIVKCLYDLGYGVTVDHVNFADYGVPQSRKRMIVRAIKGVVFMPYLPPKQKWIGWYRTDIRKKRIPSDTVIQKSPVVGGIVLIDGQNTSNTFRGGRGGLTYRLANEPSFTLSANKKITEYVIKDGDTYYCANFNDLKYWQTFPDSYILPDSKTLACKIIGNAVPPVGMAHIIKSVLI